MGEKLLCLSRRLSFSEGWNLRPCGRERMGRKGAGSDPTPPQTKGADGWPSSVLGWGEKTHAMERRALPWSSFQPPQYKRWWTGVRGGGGGGGAYNEKRSETRPHPPLARDLCSSLHAKL